MVLALHTIFFNFFFPKFCEKAIKTTVIICDWSTMSISDYSTTVLQRLIQSPPFAHNGNFLMFKWFFIQSCTNFGGMIRSGSVCSAIYCLIFATNHAFSQAGWIIFMTMISIARLPSENGFKRQTISLLWSGAGPFSSIPTAIHCTCKINKKCAKNHNKVEIQLQISQWPYNNATLLVSLK